MSILNKIINKFQKGKINFRDFDGLLVGGVLGICLAVIVSVVIISLSYHGIIGKKEYPLYCVFQKGVGLRTGAKVQLNGVNIGRVDDIELMDDNRVKLHLLIDAEFQNNITTTSEVFAARDQNLISERVILFSRPVTRGRVLKSGETIIAGEAQDIETVLENVSSMLAKVSDMVITVENILALMGDSSSTVGSLIGSNKLYKDIENVIDILQGVSVDGADVMDDVKGLMVNANAKVPSILNDMDSLTGTAVGYLDNLDKIINTIDTASAGLKGVVDNANSLLGGAGNLLVDADQKLNKLDNLMDGMSKFWFIKRRIPNRIGVSNILEDEW